MSIKNLTIALAIMLTIFVVEAKAFVDADNDGWWDITSYNDLVTLSSNPAYWGGQYEIRLPYPQVNIVVPTTPTPNLTPIGNALTPFSGKFRGLDPTDSDVRYRNVQYKIIGLRQYFPGQDNIGLFGVNTGEIKNVVLSKATITGNDIVGAFCGLNKGRIYNCQFYVNDINAKTTVTGYTKVGGFIGSNLDTVANCKPTIQRLFNYVYVEVTGDYHVGGFVGYNSTDTSQILNCEVYNTQIHDGSNAYGFGGFVGYNQGRITNSYVRGYTVVEDNTNSGYLGGFVGNSIGGTILNCGVSDSATVGTTGYYSNYTGGFAGKNVITIQYSNSGAKVYGRGFVGGFVGLDSGSVYDCSSRGSVYGTANCVGGFVGCDKNDIQRCYVSGSSNIAASGVLSDFVGGFTGKNIGNIQYSCSKGNITSSSDTVGGFMGACYGNVHDCYSRGSIIALGNAVGGFVGTIEPTGLVVRCFSAGVSIAPSSTAGGFVQYNNYGWCTQCLWNAEILNLWRSASGTGYWTIDAKSWIPYTNWDFTYTWEFNSENDGYPSFRNVPTYKVNFAQEKSKIEIYPNPVSDASTININKAEQGYNNISVYNINGQKLETLFAGNIDTSNYSIDFDGNNYTTGMYYLVVESNNTRKMEPILVRH